MSLGTGGGGGGGGFEVSTSSRRKTAERGHCSSTSIRCRVAIHTCRHIQIHMRVHKLST